MRYLNLSEDNVYSSVLGLDNKALYGFYGEYVSELPVASPYGPDRMVPLFTNLITGERFYAKRFSLSGDRQSRTLALKNRRILLMNPLCGFAAWPADIIECKEGDDIPMLSPASVSEAGNKANQYAYLFPYNAETENGGYRAFSTLYDLLKKRKGETLSFNEPIVRKCICGIISAVKEADDNGYLFFDFELSRFLITDGMRFCCDFSDLLRLKAPFDGFNFWDGAISGSGAPLDFIDPYVYLAAEEKGHARLDAASRDFALASVLFYLSYGRKPYEGMILSGYTDDLFDPLLHRDYLENHYLRKQNINFIFGGVNENCLNTEDTDFFAKDIELWENSPSTLRQMFSSAFRRANVLYTSARKYPTPADWERTVTELKWVET